MAPRAEFWEGLIHPEQRELFRDNVQGHAQGHTKQFDCEYQLRTKSGEYYWRLERGRAIGRDDAGQAVRMVGSSFDIGHSKMAEFALVGGVETLCRSIVKTSGAAVIVLTPRGRIVEWNPAAEHIFGSTRREVLGENCVERFVPERLQGPATEGIERLLAGGGEGESIETPVITRDGTERQLLWNATRLVDSKGEAWAVVGIGLPSPTESAPRQRAQ